ncbi:trace amine-associated receptor 1-like [Antedon mediterranea]|uniref:trace amine-associated receptor 1-like n=1 Tax=Antedon mediterranea TaxID=105859 RepID=UPI003AF4397A
MDETFTNRNVTTDEMRDNLIFVLSVYIPLDLVIIVGNSLVLFVLRQTRNYDASQFVLLGSLAFVDLLTGIIAVPMFMWACILRGSLYLQNIDVCQIQYIPSNICISVSVCHLLFITVDRYVSIMKPLQYHKLVNLNRIYFSIALSWVIGCVYGTVELFWAMDKIEGIFFCYQIDQRASDVQRYITLFMMSIGTILLITMYFRIVLEARKHERHIVSIPVSTRNIVRRRYRAAKTSAIIIGAFVIVYLPYTLRPVVYSFGYQRSDLYWYVLIGDVLIYMNSAVNPFIYVCRLQQFSSALRRIFNKKSSYKVNKRNSTETVNCITDNVI